jgi:hypothetical protein
VVEIRWIKKMKITKSRLLQIIREEVELHEKNTFDISEEDLNAPSTEKPVPTDKNGNVKNPEDILKQAAGGKLEELDVEEDRLFGPKDPKGKRPIIEPENGRDKLEIKIR